MSIISFSVWFHLILFLSLTNCIISGKVLRNHNINDWTWRNAYLQICDLLLFSQEVCRNSDQIDLNVHGKKDNCFYAFALMIHYLAREGFLICIQIFF